jgi:L-lactate dehydrogenase complex protein LldF
MKAVILGESSVGKTNLLIRYTEDRFEDYAKNTIGIDLKNKIVNKLFTSWTASRGDLNFSNKTFNQLWKEREKK